MEWPGTSIPSSSWGIPVQPRTVHAVRKNRTQLKAVQVSLEIGGVTVNPGDLLVCDGSGCLVIAQHIAAEVIRRARAVEHTERQIIGAITAGASLEEARKTYRYDQPWLDAAQKVEAELAQ